MPLEPELGVRRYLLLVDYDFPLELHDHLDWVPPARMKVGKGLYGPHTADMAEPLPVALREARALPRHARRGGRGRQADRAYRFACSPFMAGFMELKHSERRQLKTAGSVVAEKAPSSAAAA